MGGWRGAELVISYMDNSVAPKGLACSRLSVVGSEKRESERKIREDQTEREPGLGYKGVWFSRHFCQKREGKSQNLVLNRATVLGFRPHTSNQLFQTFSRRVNSRYVVRLPFRTAKIAAVYDHDVIRTSYGNMTRHLMLRPL